MLDEHVFDGFLREIGIDGLPAEGVKVVEAADKGGIAAALVGDEFFDGAGEFGDALGEIVDGFFPFEDVRRFVVEEGVDDVHEGVGLFDAVVENFCVALIEDGAFGSLEDDVVARVAFVELAGDFAGEIVVFVFGFPVAVGEVVHVDESAVDDDGGASAFDAVFGNESELGTGPLSALGQECLEGAADGAFVVDGELAELVELVAKRGTAQNTHGFVRRFTQDRRNDS